MKLPGDVPGGFRNRPMSFLMISTRAGSRKKRIFTVVDFRGRPLPPDLRRNAALGDEFFHKAVGAREQRHEKEDCFSRPSQAEPLLLGAQDAYRDWRP
jgi:hypothetical protein